MELDDNEKQEGTTDSELEFKLQFELSLVGFLMKKVNMGRMVVRKKDTVNVKMISKV